MPRRLAVSSVRDSASGDLILKVVNDEDRALSAELHLESAGDSKRVTITVLTAVRPDVANVDGQPPAARPVVMQSRERSTFSHLFPAHSFTILRFQ